MQGCEKYTSVYMDDILIYSSNYIEHLVYVLHVMDLLNEAKLYVKAAKCEWLVDQVEFLGHWLSHGTISLTPLYEEAIRQ